MVNNLERIREDLRPVKISIWPEMGKEICVRVRGIENYKDALLTIFNNVREDGRLYKVSNDSTDCIYITCDPVEVGSVSDWVAQWGEVVEVQDVLVFRAEEPIWDYEKYADALIIWED